MHFGFYFCFLSSSPLWLANHAFHTKEILWSIQHHRTHQRWRCTFILMALLWTFRLQVSLSRWTFYNQQKIMQTRQSTIRPFWAFSPYFFHLFFSSMCSSETVAVLGGYYDCVVQWYGLVRPPPQQRLRAKDWATSWSQLWHMLFFTQQRTPHFRKLLLLLASPGASSCLYVTLLASSLWKYRQFSSAKNISWKMHRMWWKRLGSDYIDVVCTVPS